MRNVLALSRTLLILGRVSNLPTVWSDLVAGWFLAGKGISPVLVPLLTGGSFLYIGGMYLNDFCDVTFDTQHRRERPIPAQQISRRMVGVLALVWFVAGLVCLAPLGSATLTVALVLLATIVFYDFWHKGVPWAPLIMGACRLLLYPLAASAVGPILLGPVWTSAAALGLYVAGITYVARGESRPDQPARGALVLLLLPLPVAFSHGLILQTMPGSSLLPLAIFSLALLGWMAWLLVPLWRKTNRSVGRVVAGLLAGIVLVDALLVTSMRSDWTGAWLLPLFALALLLQRIIPAT